MQFITVLMLFYFILVYNIDIFMYVYEFSQLLNYVFNLF